jgi:hypothetical protein
MMNIYTKFWLKNSKTKIISAVTAGVVLIGGVFVISNAISPSYDRFSACVGSNGGVSGIVFNTPSTCSTGSLAGWNGDPVSNPTTTTTGNVTTTTSNITTTTQPVTTTTQQVTTTTGVVNNTGTCGQAGTSAVHQKVVVFAMENRTFSDVGGSQFQGMPYLHSLAVQCSTFSNYTEPNISQSSATQYVGVMTGDTTSNVLNDCSPASNCNTTQNNLFRQARTAGLNAINYVEGTTLPCDSSGNDDNHIPTLYLWGSTDRSFCTTNTRPYSEFNPNNLVDFSFITPTLCNDGHDCSDSVADNWLKNNMQPVLDSIAYKAGQVSVEVWYDEDHPTPNMQLSIHTHPGINSIPINYGSMLKAWEDLLGVPNINNAITATDMRSISGW